MDDVQYNELKDMIRGIQTAQAGALSIIMLELTETRALVQTILGTQGGIFSALGRPETEIRFELQKALNQVVDQELARVTKRIEGVFAGLPERIRKIESELEG